MSDEETLDESPRGLRFNEDEKWIRWVLEKYESVIEKIAFKACGTDRDIREDLKQEARMALCTVFPEEVSGYADYATGMLTERQWKAKLDPYLRNVIRNSILAYASSEKTGNWYVGRKKLRKNKDTGISEYVPTASRYVPLDVLTSGKASAAVQIGTDGVLYVPGEVDLNGEIEFRLKEENGG